MLNTNKLKVLVLTFTPIKSEPRALKQIIRLKETYDVTTAGFGPAALEGVKHIELDPAPKRTGLFKIPGFYPLLLLLRMHRFFADRQPRTVNAFDRLSKEKWDIIIAHDVATMPLANALHARKGVLCDLHEYAPRQNENSFLWRLLIAPYFRWLIKTEVAKATEVTTVSDGIVKEYKKQFGLETELVINATPFHDFAPTKVSSPIKLVHSGIPGRGRKLEIMIEGVKLSKADVTLDLYLMNSDPSYLDELKSLAADDKRITFQEPVAYNQLLTTLNLYDLGVSLIAPTTFNLEWCLPNKFFDFIQARLGVLIGPSAEMVRFVNEFEIGAVTEDFTPESFAKLLNSLTLEQVAAWKENSNRNARVLSSEKQVEVWADSVDRIAYSSHV